MTRLQLRHLTTAVETALREAETNKSAAALYVDAVDLRLILKLLSGAGVTSETLRALRRKINARLQTSAINRDRASAAGRIMVAECRQSDVETLEWVIAEIDALEAAAAPQTQETP